MSARDDEEWARWAAARPAAEVLHLDSAAAGRSSRATLAAVAGHALREAETGGYVAQERARDELARLRADVAGLLGTDADGVAFVESATAALEALLGAWDLPPGARVGVPAAAWGPDLEILLHAGLGVEVLDVDAAGVLDLASLEQRLRRDPPDLLLVDQVAAHRGLVQPVAQVIGLAGHAGVPVWVDAAQAVGQVPLVPGADAVFATGRKWLTGPRGVGMLAVAAHRRAALHVRRAAKHPDLPAVQHLESDEAHVAGRIGLGVAVRELLDLGPEKVAARLAEVGQRTRDAVGTLTGWSVVHPEAPAGATTSLLARAGQDVARTRARLLGEHAILTTVCLPWRAPREQPPDGVPMLRLSPHVDLDDDALERVCRALSQA